MIQQLAHVVAIEGDHAVVEAAAAAGCSTCAAQGGCATSKLGGLLRQGPRLWRLPNALGLQAGDNVILGLPEEALLAAALSAYLAPLLGLLAGALIAAALTPGDVWPLAGAIAGFLLGAIAARPLGRAQAARHTPQMVAGSSSQALAPIRFI